MKLFSLCKRRRSNTKRSIERLMISNLILEFKVPQSKPPLLRKRAPSSTSHGSSINPFTHRSSSRQSTPIGKRVGYFELDGDSSEEPTTSDDEDKIGNVSTTHPNFSNPSPFKESSLNSSVLPSNDSGNDPSIKGSQDDPVKDEPKDTGLKSD